jgi:diaminopimelate epimerase
MATFEFAKSHGLGNDFILLRAMDAQVKAADLTSPEMVQRICDRHRGIGADGLIVLLPPQNMEAHSQMIILNADGSRPEMCGNGIRCAAKWLHDEDIALRGQPALDIETDAGTLRCQLTKAEDGTVSQVRVAMGRPVLDRPRIPMTGGEGSFVDQPFSVGTQQLKSTAVSMGNPHLVTFVEGAIEPRALAEALGPTIERHPAFPQRTNVEFARIKRGAENHVDEIELWVWERGCGITQACGTGACATAVAGVLTKRIPANASIRTRLPGGVLTIEVATDLSQVWMTGPAVTVFHGSFTV